MFPSDTHLKIENQMFSDFSREDVKRPLSQEQQGTVVYVWLFDFHYHFLEFMTKFLFHPRQVLPKHFCDKTHVKRKQLKFMIIECNLFKPL